MHQSMLLASLLVFPLLPSVFQATGQEIGSSAPPVVLPAPASEVRVYIDPETGQITNQPTPEQQLELNQLVRLQKQAQATSPLATFELRGGGTGVRLDQRFFSSLTVRPDHAGWTIGCQADHDHATVPAPTDGQDEPEQTPAVPVDSQGRAVQ